MSGFPGDLADRLPGREGTRWAGSVADLLYVGETVRGRVPVGEADVQVAVPQLEDVLSGPDSGGQESDPAGAARSDGECRDPVQ